MVLLNLNIIMSSYGEVHPHKGYASVAAGVGENTYWRTSWLISWVLAVINVLGYVFIVVFLGVTEIPIVIRQTDEYVEEQKYLIRDKRGYFNPGAFKWWFVTLVFNIMFIIMHMSVSTAHPDMVWSKRWKDMFPSILRKTQRILTTMLLKSSFYTHSNGHRTTQGEGTCPCTAF